VLSYIGEDNLICCRSINIRMLMMSLMRICCFCCCCCYCGFALIGNNGKHQMMKMLMMKTKSEDLFVVVLILSMRN
jgi:hypothetical protein